MSWGKYNTSTIHAQSFYPLLMCRRVLKGFSYSRKSNLFPALRRIFTYIRGNIRAGTRVTSEEESIPDHQFSFAVQVAEK